MKRARSVSAPKYKATTISPEVREALANVCCVLHEDGMSYSDVADVFLRAGYPLARSTLANYNKAIASGGKALSDEKGSGRSPCLDDLQQRVMAGFVLEREDRNLKTSSDVYKAYCRSMFAVSLSTATACRYMTEAELSYRLLGARHRATKLMRDEMILDAMDCLQRLHSSGVLKTCRSHLWNIDVVTDTQRLLRDSSWGRRGGRQTKFRGLKLVYTSSLITLVNANGEQVGPAIFTSNPDLDPDGPNGKQVRKMLRAFGLRVQDLYYVADGDKYLAESRAMYSSFLDDTAPWEGHVVITDQNTIFEQGGSNLFLDKGFTAAPKLNAPSHGPLSINDGVLHKLAKPEWKAQLTEDMPQWERTLRLAWCIIHVDKDTVARKWDEHFQLNQRLSRGRVEKVLFGAKTVNADREKFFARCAKDYKEWVREHGEPEVHIAPVDLQDRLDGAEWKPLPQRKRRNTASKF